MNKKEIAEIRKQFTPENCSITRIASCYVDHEKNRLTYHNSSFLSLDEEECFKYFDLFKKTLSGSIGKNLLSIDFPAEQERSGGTQHRLMELRQSRLQDDNLIDTFFQDIIDNYNYPENYLIILIHAAYDIPGKSSDGSTIFDASDMVYEHLLCSICPVKLSKPGLSYHAENSAIACRTQDWVVDKPDKGFLFPAFTERTADVHHALYYTKKSDDLAETLLDTILGGTIPLSADEQKNIFRNILDDITENNLTYDMIRNIHDNLNEQLEEHANKSEPLALTKSDIERILVKSGFSNEALANYDAQFDKYMGDNKILLAANLANDKSFQVAMTDVKIQVKTDRADLLETQIINGRKCLVINVDDNLTVNEIPANA